MKKFKKLIPTLLAATFILSACQPAQPTKDSETAETSTTATAAAEATTEPAAQTTAAQDTMVYGIDGDPGNSVNVLTTGDRYGLMVVKQIYSPLYMYNGADNINYFLAESMTASEDGLSFTAKLRENVLWHDGTPFTADDVVFTYEQMAKPENAGVSYSKLVASDGPVVVEKIDNYNVKFTFPSRRPAPLETLGGIFIMPKHIYEGETDMANTPLNAQYIGTGPYKMEEYAAGQHVKFVANEDYYLGAPKIPHLVFKIATDPNTALLALQSGELDALAVTPVDVEKVEGDTALTVYPVSENRVGYMAFNMKSENVQDKEVRQAILYSLNKSDMIEAGYVSPEFAEEAVSFLPKKATYYTSEIDGYEFNPEKAKELVAKTGADKLTFKLGYSGNNKVYQAQAAIAQQNMKDVGLTLELMPLEPSAFGEQLESKDPDYDMYLNGYIMEYDPDSYDSLFTTDSAYNFMSYSNPTVDELFAQGKVETDAAKRKAIYEELQQVIIEDAAYFPIQENKRILVMDSKIKGVEEAVLVPVFSFDDTSKLYFEE